METQEIEKSEAPDGTLPAGIYAAINSLKDEDYDALKAMYEACHGQVTVLMFSGSQETWELRSSVCLNFKVTVYKK
jgi:hypothetical protein